MPRPVSPRTRKHLLQESIRFLKARLLAKRYLLFDYMGCDPGLTDGSQGLSTGDLLLSLGNATRMADLPALVADNEEKTLLLSVRREDQTLSLRLIPKRWQGNVPSLLMRCLS